MISDHGPGSSERDVVIAMIVDQALDDLEAAHIDLPTALTLTALAAWGECERAGRRTGLPVSRLDFPTRASGLPPDGL